MKHTDVISAYRKLGFDLDEVTLVAGAFPIVDSLVIRFADEFDYVLTKDTVKLESLVTRSGFRTFLVGAFGNTIDQLESSTPVSFTKFGVFVTFLNRFVDLDLESELSTFSPAEVSFIRALAFAQACAFVCYKNGIGRKIALHRHFQHPGIFKVPYFGVTMELKLSLYKPLYCSDRISIEYFNFDIILIDARATPMDDTAEIFTMMGKFVIVIEPERSTNMCSIASNECAFYPWPVPYGDAVRSDVCTSPFKEIEHPGAEPLPLISDGIYRVHFGLKEGQTLHFQKKDDPITASDWTTTTDTVHKAAFFSHEMSLIIVRSKEMKDNFSFQIASHHLYKQSEIDRLMRLNNLVTRVAKYILAVDFKARTICRAHLPVSTAVGYSDIIPLIAGTNFNNNRHHPNNKVPLSGLPYLGPNQIKRAYVAYRRFLFFEVVEDPQLVPVDVLARMRVMLLYRPISLPEDSFFLFESVAEGIMKENLRREKDKTTQVKLKSVLGAPTGQSAPAIHFQNMAIQRHERVYESRYGAVFDQKEIDGVLFITMGLKLVRSLNADKDT